MRKKCLIAEFLFLMIFGAGLFPAFAGDSFSGKVTEVRSAEVIVVDYGTGEYIVRIVGINVPKEGAITDEAKKFVTAMVLGKLVRARFQGRQGGEMVSRVFVGDPGKDVGLELVRAGLARRQQGSDPEIGYKYGELSAAEREAQKARRGLWATAQPK